MLQLGVGVGFVASASLVVFDDLGLALDADEAVARAYDGVTIIVTRIGDLVNKTYTTSSDRPLKCDRLSV